MLPQTPILVVEDDRDIRDTLVDALVDEGFNVVSAIDGVDALDKLRQGLRPSVMLLDLMMPRLNGAGVCEAMAQVPAWGEIPVVIFTADPEARSRARALGVMGCLNKPVKLKELLETVERFTQRKKAEPVLEPTLLRRVRVRS
jgi:CheY-like chemotaxis protein